ncbi:MAG: universal stress protein, partial [Pseudomonadota bacterium]
SAKAELKSGASEVGQTLLGSAADVGADLLLMGAYGQSRQFELVMGGVTRHVVERAEIPVLLTH